MRKLFIIIIFFLILTQPIFAAFSGSMVWEVRTTGSDSNGGGFRGGSNLAAPSAPGLSTLTTGGSIPANTYYFVITYWESVNTSNGSETVKSAQASVTTTGSASTITVTSPSSPYANGKGYYRVYAGTTNGGPWFVQNSGTLVAVGTNLTLTATPATTGNGPPGIDYSQQDSPQTTYNDLVIQTSTRISSSAHAFGVNDVGNILNITGGSGFTVQRVEILNVDASGATVDKALGTVASSGGIGVLGGGLATPGMVGSLITDQNWCFIKNGTYACSSTANVSGGKVTNSANTFWVGYNTTRTIWNMDASRPTLQAGANSMEIINLGGGNHQQALKNLILDGNGHTSVTGANLSFTRAQAFDCKATGCATGFTCAATTLCVNCEATNCSTAHFSGSGSYFYACIAHDGASGGDGFSTSAITQCHNCLVTKLAASRTAFTGAGSTQYVNCAVYFGTNSGTKGFSLTSNAQTLINCYVEGAATGYDKGSSSGPGYVMYNCAGFNNTADFANIQGNQLVNYKALTSTAFMDATNNNFALNTIVGGGNNLRAAGYPTTITGLSTVNYLDIGAIQHRDPPINR